MSLLVSEHELEGRRTAAAGPLRPLAESLAADLEVVAARELFFPAEKALLSREGGRCARDGTLLTFDPFEPRVHVCPMCGTEYRGELHYRFWIYWYQLWLAERAVHAAVLHRLGVGDYAPLASAILGGYAERYASYPNVDNVLGPTRLFFSTYLESIWLLQVCVATDLLAPLNPALADRVRDRIVEPSRSIIREYDERGSNRQVWNSAALVAAARVLGDDAGAERALFGASGVMESLSTSLLPDGTWYEGENYHLFAHRGLWYGVTMAEVAGMTLPPDLANRFQLGFATPFATALPDFTLPSRRDSQYAIPLRQWRIAEHCELGFARRADVQIAGALERMYRDDIPRRGTNRATSSADAERNAPASSLTRADLSWRALLCALPELPPLAPIPPRSVLLRDQGIAEFRRNAGRTYVALDYGHSGGGHGHADRLNVLLARDDTRWLDDYGTGSYVDPSLHWYRSTLAHNAPLVGGRSQPPLDGVLETYDEGDAVGWIRAAATVGGTLRRTVVVMDDYFVDVLDASEADGVVDLPMHADFVFDRGAGAMEAAPLEGGQGLEDGFRFVRETERQRVVAGVVAEGRAVNADKEIVRLWTRANADAEWWRGVAAGPPGAGDRAFRVVRIQSPGAELTNVIAWSDRVASVDIDDGIHVTLADGVTHVHRRDGDEWRIEQRNGDDHSMVVLRGREAPIPSKVSSQAAPVRREPIRLRRDASSIVELGETHYRRSEQTWSDAGRPTAQIELRPNRNRLRVVVRVRASEYSFVRPGATNRYDNESPDINGDGIQLYVLTDSGQGGWLLVPDAESTDVFTRPIDKWQATFTPTASWSRVRDGYEVDIDLPVLPTAIDVIVNEKPVNRERRRGQLVLSGARQEFVYLRGDRQDVSRLIPIEIVDV